MADTQRDTSLLQVPGNDNRAKSPFEIGEKTDMQIASSKAIIDKALIMDVSGGITKNIDEYISLFFTDFCALDKASCADISEVKVVVVEEVEEPEVVEEPEPEDPDMVEIEIEVSEEETGDDGVVKRVKRKVMKKVHKDEVPKQEEPPAETPAERKRRERMEKLAAKKGAEGGAEEAVEGEGGESGNESGEGKEDKTEVKPEDTESNVGGGDEDDDDTASVTSETSTKKKTKKKKKKGAAPEPIPEPEPEPEPIEDIPEPKPAPKEPDSDDDLIYPKEVFDNPDVWQKIDSAELLSAEEQARIASARQSVHLMTERERDLEWQRQRTLLRPPLIVSHLKARAAPVGGTAKLTCTVTGPELTVKWLKDGNPIEKSFEKYRFQVTETLLSLEILKLDIHDVGEYQCEIKNKNGACDTKATVKVYEPFEIKPIPPTFVSLKEQYSINSDELVLECRVRGTPRPHIAWMKDGDYIIPGDKHEQYETAEGTCKLVICTPEESDCGTYTCEAECGGVSDTISHNVHFEGANAYILQKVHGFYHRSTIKPHFIIGLTDNSICSGGSIILNVEAPPSCEAKWYRDKKLLVQKLPKTRMFAENGFFGLCIQGSTMDESGAYTCRIENSFGINETTSHVDIINPNAVKGLKPPIFFARPQPEIRIRCGDPLSMSFRVNGDPKPKIMWMKGCRDITNSNRTIKEAHSDYIRFSFKDTTQADEGTYFIVARNKLGVDRAFCHVSVGQNQEVTPESMPAAYESTSDFTDVSYLKKSPNAIPFEPVVVDSGKSHLSLSWMKPPSTDTAPVLAYRVDAWLDGKEGGAIWQEIGITPTHGFDVFGLKADADYHFRVTPRNRYGWGPSVQTTYPITFGKSKQMPEFTKILPGQVKALVNHPYSLECIAQGTPKPDILWYKNGIRLESSDRISTHMIGPLCRLLITEVQDEDSGRYTCEATNKEGRVSTFARLMVVSDSKIMEVDTYLKRTLENNLVQELLPQFTMRLRDRRVQVSYPVRLSCQAIGCPSPDVTWYKDGIVVHGNDRISTWKENHFHTMEISRTILEDSGQYTATAKNELGSVSCHCDLVVDKGIRAYIAPEFYTELHSIYTFTEGSEIRITGQVEAYPSVGVTWHRDGLRLRPSRRFILTLDNEGCVELIIADATRQDCGVYTCVASNAVGRAESTCRVVLEDDTNSKSKSVPRVVTPSTPYSKEPLFVKKPRSSEAYEGDTVIIMCEVIGDPKPEVVWLRDFLKPEYYKDASHFRRVGDGPEYRLEIPFAKLDYTGTYSVIAKNCHGETKAIISLQIIAKDLNKKDMAMHVKLGNVETLPTIIRQLKDVRCCDGDSVTLECHVEGIPEPTISWQKDGRKINNISDFMMSFDNLRATLSIRRIYPEDEGEYTCIASNNVGKAYSSACVIVDVPEEKENLLSRQLTRPMALLSASSTPRSTPRSTPLRSVSPYGLARRRDAIPLESKYFRFSAPRFYYVPHNRVVEEGDSVRFQCAITGHPPPWATWDKDGLIVTPTTRIKIRERDDTRILEIDEVTPEDAGLYRITLENDFGRIEATARLDVITNRAGQDRNAKAVSAPSSRRSRSTSRRIMGYSTGIGGRMALSFQYRSSSIPSKKVYHNSKEIVDCDRVNIVSKPGEYRLTIENAQLSDAGDYTIILEDEHGITSHTARLNVYKTKDRFDRTPPAIVTPLREITEAFEGIPLDLQVKVASTEPFNFIWTKNKQIITDSDDFQYIDHGNGRIALRIIDPFVFDTSVYSCIVTSANGTCESKTRLSIKEYVIHDTVISPKYLKKPLATVVLEKTVVSFCARISPADCETEWHVCGQRITNDSKGFLLENQPNGIRFLHIVGVKLQHSGEIKCTSFASTDPDNLVVCYIELVVLPNHLLEPNTNSNQFQSHQIVLNNNNKVDCTPYFVQKPEDCTTLVGEIVVLDAYFEGHPEPKVTWLRAGRLIEENTNTEIITLKNHSTLIIRNVTANQSGKYTVEIMNEYNTDSASASVAVEGIPDAPGGKPSISIGPDRVSIAWCGPPYDGGCMLTGFTIEIKENDQDWQEIGTVVDSLSYTVKNLKQNLRYRFRVRAENVHGQSEPGQQSEEVILQNEDEPGSAEIDTSVLLEHGGSFNDRFEVLEELGKGRFGVVRKVIERDSGHVLAAKIIKCRKAADKEKVKEEIAIMEDLKHPKLLFLATYFEELREMIMVTEYITGGELFERVVADDFTLTERDCILFLRQICEAVDYMHSQSIVHLDLKPENIMCRTRTSHQLKIIDFGLAQKLSPDKPMRVLFGTPEFVPPEIINYEPIGLKSDMWSVGVICYVLLSGLSPFMGDTDVDTFSNITRADYDFDDDAFDAVSQEARDFIQALLLKKKEHRLEAKECLETPWLTQKTDNISDVALCTDKLKKFIIRRKWQKTGNAIRALGRMANLSASRKNSANNTPRHSISGSLLPNSQTTPVKMSSLSETEPTAIETELDSIKDLYLKSLSTTLKEKNCCERSDSGFSECSGCSLVTNLCTCHTQSWDKNYSISEELGNGEEHHDINTVASPYAQLILKSKLDNVVTATPQQFKDESEQSDVKSEYSSENSVFIDNTKDFMDENDNSLDSSYSRSKEENCESLPSNIGLRRTMSIEKTKRSWERSLENINAKEQELHQPNKEMQKLPSQTKSGTVSKLKEKFSFLQNQNDTDFNAKPKPMVVIPLYSKSSALGVARKNGSNSGSNGNSMECSKSNGLKTKSINERFANKSVAANKPTFTNLTSSSNTADNISTATTAAPTRLTGRVKEVTDRLTTSRTSLTPSSGSSNISGSGGSLKLNLTDRTTNATTTNKEHFKKASEFWKK